MASIFDGCLANFSDSYARLLTKETGIEFPKVSQDHPKEWYWERAAGVTKQQEKAVWERDILAKGSRFWLNLKPMDGAGTVIRRLNELSREGHDVYFITHRMGAKAKLQTEKWLYEHGMNFPTVLLSGDKVPLIRALEIEFFVDDKPETVLAVANVMPWTVYMQAAPYNADVVLPKNVVKVGNVEEALRWAKLW